MKLEVKDNAARVEIAAELDAAGLEQLIVKLAMLRSQISPPVPEKPPGAQPEQEERSVLVCDDAGMLVAQMQDGRFRFWMRNTGIGWCAYNVPPSTAHGVSKFIASKGGSEGEGVDLFSHQGGQRH